MTIVFTSLSSYNQKEKVVDEINLNLLYAMIAPLVLFLLVYVLFIRHEREVVFKGIMCFFVGMLTVLPAASFENYFIPEGLPTNIWGTMISNFLFVGFIEEFLKLVVGYYAVKQLAKVNLNANTFLFLLFAAGIGFSFMENIIYVYNSGLETALLRSFSSIPMHGATAIVIGYFGYLEVVGKTRYGWLKGLVLAVVMHGLYNTYAVELNYSFWFYGIFVISFFYLLIATILLFLNRRGKEVENLAVSDEPFIVNELK